MSTGKDCVEKKQGKNSRKKPFKQTKELVRLALNDGWTQNDIAAKCRTQQSIVSKWKKGTSQGNEEQLKPLLDLYGHKIRRNSYRLYWDFYDFEDSPKYFKVEGKVILDELIGVYNGEKYYPDVRVVVHYQGEDKFQSLFLIKNSLSRFKKLSGSSLWQAILLPSCNKCDLLDKLDKDFVAWCDNRINESYRLQLKQQAKAIPFILRSALLQHGFVVDDVKLLHANW